MSRFKGWYYDGRSARRYTVDVSVLADGYLSLRGEDLALEFGLAGIRVPPPLGEVPRTLELPDGQRLEMNEGPELASALSPWVERGPERFGALMERLWHWAMVALVMTVAFSYVAVDRGIPWAAQQIADSVPYRWEQALGDEAIDTFVKLKLLQPTRLDKATIAGLSERVHPLARTVPGLQVLKLRFADAPSLGANAFAVPGGYVVVTDQLVKLAQNDSEIVAVIAHELGHLHYRHGLRAVLQDAGVSVLVAGLLGDVVSASTLAAALPAFLMNASYSRGMEREADAFALDLMHRHGIEPVNFARIMRRLDPQGDGGGQWHSTHPATAERIKAFE